MTANEFLKDMNCLTDEAGRTKAHKRVAVLPVLCVFKQGLTPTNVVLTREKRAP